MLHVCAEKNLLNNIQKHCLMRKSVSLSISLSIIFLLSINTVAQSPHVHNLSRREEIDESNQKERKKKT